MAEGFEAPESARRWFRTPSAGSTRWLLPVLAASLMLPRAALAHKLNVFAHVEGTTIRGNAYFRGGTPAQKVQVTALDGSGRELGRTTTDSEGNFAMDAHARCDHRLVADTGDGHGGEYTVPAAELPASLSAGTAIPALGHRSSPAGDSSPAGPPGPRESLPASSLRAEIQALEAQVVALREQLAQNDEQVRFRDILGGLGYILGLTGVAFYVLGAKRNRTS